jgi:hypothetical protein
MDEDMPPVGLTRWVPEFKKQWVDVSRDTRKLVDMDMSGWDVDAGIHPTRWWDFGDGATMPPPPAS